MLDPLAAAETTNNPATETINNVTETINKRNGSHNKNVTETIKQPTTETSPKNIKQELGIARDALIFWILLRRQNPQTIQRRKP